MFSNFRRLKSSEKNELAVGNLFASGIRHSFKFTFVCSFELLLHQFSFSKAIHRVRIIDF